ncbi:hypothetical protein ARMGADRAFT_1035693 [Armillaria gallica]|uniref:Uncharacterized protein n=1 Tax=Armillaria gallica TaxID=47427 RepID=A0A2H3CT49_ARMGA|nr:hypothetical protein ARMGADRAFT_1035693 [Armillaria gallica]
MYARGIEEDHWVVNYISLSSSGPSTSHPLELILSSHLCAFDKTSDVNPHSATTFWFIATKGVATNVAMDNLGVGSSIEVVCGCKMWYLFQCCDAEDNNVISDWEPGFVLNPNHWTAEVVLLKPGSVLYILGMSTLNNADTEAVTYVPTLTTQ